MSTPNALELSVAFAREPSLAVQALSLHLATALNTPYRADIELETDDADELARHLRQRVTVTARYRDDARTLHGVVTAVTDRGWTAQGVRAGRRRVALSVAPWLAVMEHRVDRRIFQDRTAREVVDAVVAAHPEMAAVTWRVPRALPRREYIAQYEESDAAFITRLISEEGLFFAFTHEGSREEMVVFEGVGRARDRAAVSVPLVHGGAEVGARASLRTFSRRRAVTADRATLRDYDFTRPGHASAFTVSEGDGALEAYAFPGRYVFGGYQGDKNTLDDAHPRTEIEHGRALAARDLSEGVGDAIDLGAGDVFALESPEHAGLEGRYAVLRAELDVVAPERAVEGAAHTEGSVRSAVWCADAGSSLRPAVPPRPLARGPETAIVANEHDEVECDAHGRIRVRFQWQRARSLEGEHTRTAWVRVATSTAGERWGQFFVPRKGMEVVVDFLHGDPERPIVTGCVYNGAHRPPWAEHPTRNGLRTQSTPHDATHDGHNELSFEDQRGAEEVFLRAQRNLRARVLADHTVHVGHDESRVVDHDQTLRVGHDQTEDIGRHRGVHVVGHDTLDVNRDRMVTVLGNSVEKVHGARAEAVGALSPREGDDGCFALDVQKDHDTTVGHRWHVDVRAHGTSIDATDGTVVIRARDRIELSCGGGMLEMRPDAIRVAIGSVLLRLTRDGVVEVANGAGANLRMEGPRTKVNV